MGNSVGVIGGGLMGLATAFYLARAGHRVTVFEQEASPGGLCRSAEFLPGLRWDRYYHVILSTDDALLAFLRDIGLDAEVCFADTRTGFFTDGALHSLSSTRDFLAFPPLAPWDKLRLGLGILYSAALRDGRRLEQQPVGQWLTRVFGRRNYEKLWGPLLRAKLGSASERASAAFIWATINRLYGTRRSASKNERMGYVRGGYRTVIDRLCQQIEGLGGRVLCEQPVTQIEPAEEGGLWVHTGPAGLQRFDHVVATVANPALARIWPGAPESFRRQLEEIEYLGIVCLALLLRRPLGPYYVTNLTDPGLPCTGIIETSALVSAGELGGHALVYLPRYLPPGDPYWNVSDDLLQAEFLAALARVHPTLGPDQVLAAAVHRERWVQPLQDLGYSDKIPPMRTPLPGLTLVNTSMIRDSTLNNNQVVQLAKQAALSLMDGG